MNCLTGKRISGINRIVGAGIEFMMENKMEQNHCTGRTARRVRCLRYVRFRRTRCGIYHLLWPVRLAAPWTGELWYRSQRDTGTER